MSKKDLGRVKQIRQKDSSGNFTTSIPIGTNGLLVDMLSNLDLEEELKLGNDHYAQITQDEDSGITTIKEWYFTEPKNGREISEMVNYMTYSAQIVIDQSEGTTTSIEMTLYQKDIQDSNKLHQKTILIDESSSSITTVVQEVDKE